MSSGRLIRNRSYRRVKNNSFEIELNSLLDVLVILLVFLIKNYTSTEAQLTIPKNLFLPGSVSSDPIVKGISVQYTGEGDLLVENELVSKSVRIWNLDIQKKFYRRMIEIQREIEATELETELSKPFSKVVNLIMDKESPFEIIDRIMNATTNAGFEQFKFIVIEKE